MSKLIGSGLQLRKAVNNFLRGATEEKNAKIYEIQDLMKTAVIDRLVAVAIYKLVSNDRHNKMESIIRLLDKKLMEYSPYPCQKEVEDHFSLSFHTQRLITLSKFKMPLEETIQAITEHILINELTERDLTILVDILKDNPVSYSQSYIKLVSHILDLVQEHIVNLSFSKPSFIVSVSFILTHSPFRLPKSLSTAINKAIDGILPHLDDVQTKIISHQMRQKSLQQWIQAGNFQTRPVRKRVCYQYILNKQYPGIQYRGYLPGTQWKDAPELEQAVSFTRSFGVNQAYIDIFPTVEDYGNPIFGYAPLQRPQFINQYIDYIFFFIKNGNRKMDKYSLFKTIRTLRSFFMKYSSIDPNANDFLTIHQRHNINLINLMVILYELGRYNIQESIYLQKATREMLGIVMEIATQDYLRQFSYSQYKHKEIITIFAFLSCLTVDALVYPDQLNSTFFKKIQIAILSHKEKKHQINHYSKMLAFYRYAKFLKEKKLGGEGSQTDILLQEKLNSNQIELLLQTYLQINTQQKQQFQITLSSFQQLFQIIRKPVFQPNVQMEYAIINKSSKHVQSVFEYSHLIEDRLTYIEQELIQESNVKVTEEGKDLTLFGAWKKTFFNFHYKCDYFYCRSEIQLALKLHKKIKALSKL